MRLPSRSRRVVSRGRKAGGLGRGHVSILNLWLAALHAELLLGLLAKRVACKGSSRRSCMTWRGTHVAGRHHLQSRTSVAVHDALDLPAHQLGRVEAVNGGDADVLEPGHVVAAVPDDVHNDIAPADQSRVASSSCAMHLGPLLLQPSSSGPTRASCRWQPSW